MNFPTRSSTVRRRTVTTTGHLFQVGQLVRMKRGLGSPAEAAEVYRVTATMPSLEGAPQYRIRSDEERHERVVTQSLLEAAKHPASSDEALLEKTFGDGHEPATITGAAESPDQD